MTEEEKLAEEYTEEVLRYKMAVHDVFEKEKTKSEIMEAVLYGLKQGSQLDKVWQDYDPGEDCYEDTHEGKWVKRENEYQWHDLQKDPTDLPKCEEDEQIIFCVKEWVESIQKYYTHYCLGFYKKAFLNEDVKLFVEKSKGYESEHLPKSVLRWRELEKLKKWETE